MPVCNKKSAEFVHKIINILKNTLAGANIKKFILKSDCLCVYILSAGANLGPMGGSSIQKAHKIQLIFYIYVLSRLSLHQFWFSLFASTKIRSSLAESNLESLILN